MGTSKEQQYQRAGNANGDWFWWGGRPCPRPDPLAGPAQAFAEPKPDEGVRRGPGDAPLLFIGDAPGRIFVKRCHCTRKGRSVRAQIFFIHSIVPGDDEGHYSGRPILRRVGDQDESAARSIWASFQYVKVVAIYKHGISP